MAEGHDDYINQGRAVPASGSPLMSHSCRSPQTRLPVEASLWPPRSNRHSEQDEDSGDCPIGTQSSERSSSRFYEELFCTSQSSIPLVPLAGALMGSSGPQSDVTKQGYLGKVERSHRRYFVLRAGSHTGPSRLEWFKNKEKFTAMEKSAGKTGLFGLNKQGTIYLRCCLGVSRIGNSCKGHTVALYANDQTMVLVTEDQQEQDDWYVAIKKLMEEEQKDEEHGEGADEEDDGYCTLPPAAFFKEVWPVTVKPRGLGSSKPLTGENRLCLTTTSLVLVRLGASSDLPSVTIPLLSVRRFGHLDGLFFLELGRSAPNGPGEIWMEAGEQGNLALAQQIHEAVRETVRALRALPDFSRSPTSSQNQPPGLLASKRCRSKYRDKLVNVRPLCPMVLYPRNPDVQTSPAKLPPRPHKPHETKPEPSLSFPFHDDPSQPQQSSLLKTEMNTDQCRAADWRMQSWDSAEDEERLGYMIMSPQTSHSSSGLAQDDYVTMESPQKPNRPAYSSSSSFSSIQTTFSSTTGDSYLPLYLSHYQTEDSQPHWLVSSAQQSETEVDQLDTSTSCSASPKDDAKEEQKSEATSPDGSVLITPFVLSEAGSIRPPLSHPNIDTGQSSPVQCVLDQSADRKYWLSACLFACLQSEAQS
ncbi:uncharacterized protein LOC121635669 [Melanotaenia boesemani]|uniref:uncharacterized protein LOC121635669 n=1 Tax=Melanotaenia boesemani TaxID=1250792 RepID=UPI001C05A01B|nr:uncharacterized protein LOC121635669 [Melanotaenia boesemani]XP_041834886.1 uncharacterized protein LOC121635669 [Melanotaenia boesemani]XP_041834887.1 uncharacterized protein LOC121635669 [Melanotaenia boesemani]